MEGLGAPIDIYAGEEAVRLQQPMTVTMKYDPSLLEEDYESGALYFLYYNGEEWEYVKADVNRQEQTMSFTASHMCMFAKGDLTFDERIDEYVDNEAIAQWAKDQKNSMTDEAISSVVDHILAEKLKISDNSYTGKILDTLRSDPEWINMVNNAREGDMDNFNQNLQLLVGKKIVEVVPESTLSSALSELTGDLGVATVEKASEAAGYLAEGQYKNAARILGEHIADQFMITKVGKFAVAAINSQIDTWKNEEIEAAYEAYKNGASSSIPWWGYQVEKGNFDDVYDQMGGAARQIELEAIRAQNEAREEAGMPALTPEEEDKIRKSVRQDLEKQFENRMEREEEIEKKKEELKLITDMYKEAGFMEKGRWGWTKEYELEQRLDILMHFKDKLLRDTERKYIKTGDVHNEEAIAIEQLKTVAMGWFSAETDEERNKIYEEFLQNEFGISLYPSVEQINGAWSSGAYTITEFDIGPPPDEAGESVQQANEEGCDLSNLDTYTMLKTALEENKGVAMGINMTFKLSPGGSGTITVTGEDGGTTEYTATYSGGTVTATGEQNDAIMTLNGRITEFGDTVTVNGSIRMDLGGDRYVKGSWTGTK
ncbi:MAG TPA: hypothetical protein DHN33_04680 [Eubacteriaceae bacterium]|nr:hypothetical protein [Eubacteriaceae bacterium]